MLSQLCRVENCYVIFTIALPVSQHFLIILREIIIQSNVCGDSQSPRSKRAVQWQMYLLSVIEDVSPLIWTTSSVLADWVEQQAVIQSTFPFKHHYCCKIVVLYITVNPRCTVVDSTLVNVRETLQFLSLTLSR